MFRFCPVKCLALAWALNAMSVAATEPGLPISRVRELDSGHRVGQFQELLQSSRQLQGEDCVKTSKALDSAGDKLSDQIFDAVDGCTTFPCTIDFKSFSSYSSYSSACSSAKGALATYKVTLSCSGLSIAFGSYPVCLVSKKTNKNCGPKLFEDFFELAIDVDDCTETVTNTGYTDFSGSKPVKKPAKMPVRRRALA
jgi:hypothetical protein